MKRILITGHRPFETPEILKVKPVNIVSELNHKLAPKVNMIYALSIILEGIAVDLCMDDLREETSKLRASVNEISTRLAESFGEWVDKVEEELMKQGSPEELLPVICIKIYSLSIKIEQEYRRIEPRFDYYQKDVVKNIQKYALNADKELLVSVGNTLNKLMYE